MRWKPFRITELWAKTTFILGAWFVVPFGLRYLLATAGVPDSAILAIDIVLGFVAVGFGCRVFRAHGEAIAPPRVWWRATGRPRAGFVLGGIFAFAALGALVPNPEADPAAWWYVVTGLPVAAFYLHSSIRLVRGDAPVPPKPRRDDDLRLIGRKQRF